MRAALTEDNQSLAIMSMMKIKYQKLADYPLLEN
jgi:hypothetical protein